MLSDLCSPTPLLQLSSLEVPPSWRKVDVLREARALQQNFLEGVGPCQLMLDVFFIKRLQTIRDFFRLCSSFAQSLSGEEQHSQHPQPQVSVGFVTAVLISAGTGLPAEDLLSSNGPVSLGKPLYCRPSGPSAAVISEEQMTRPIKAFTAEFVGQMLLGLPSQALGLALCSALSALGLDVVAQVEAKDFGAECKVSGLDSPVFLRTECSEV